MSGRLGEEEGGEEEREGKESVANGCGVSRAVFVFFFLSRFLLAKGLGEVGR